jgi:hypothetical protein
VSADHAMLRELKIASIKVRHRHRKDMGDLTGLAESIRQEGLLQPIGVTDRLELVFGERRLLAYRDILKRKTILARVVDGPRKNPGGGFLENAFRKRFSLGLEGAGSGVDDFGTVLPGGFLPARCSDFKESQEVFSAPTCGNRIGEFNKRKQGRSLWDRPR